MYYFTETDQETLTARASAYQVSCFQLFHQLPGILAGKENEIENFKMRNTILYVLSSLTILFFTSCEEEFIPDIVSDPEDIVVEGYIEAGDIDCRLMFY